jgi:hypothetical protein
MSKKDEFEKVLADLDENEAIPAGMITVLRMLHGSVLEHARVQRRLADATELQALTGFIQRGGGLRGQDLPIALASLVSRRMDVLAQRLASRRSKKEPALWADFPSPPRAFTGC